MICALYFGVLQVVIKAPPFLDQFVAQNSSAFPTLFLRAGVQPDFQWRSRTVLDRVDHIIKDTFVPPN